ncbi:hypothetical protein [Treponema sp.]|uniref:hypothetical protein n=1 Tax=Treponema sp. TaxID=166 RepID=UPI00298DFA44|nr:hypothetical protein [Treponema sp.]MCQ2240140.1 hypothetical protein [Treponema sp.]
MNKTVPEKMVKPAIACLQYVKNKFENRKLERIIEDGYDVVKNVFNQLIITIEDILTKAILKIILRRNGINGYCKIICKTATTLKLSSLETNEEIEMKAQLIADDIKSGEKILI